MLSENDWLVWKVNGTPMDYKTFCVHLLSTFQKGHYSKQAKNPSNHFQCSFWSQIFCAYIKNISVFTILKKPLYTEMFYQVNVLHSKVIDLLFRSLSLTHRCKVGKAQIYDHLFFNSLPFKGSIQSPIISFYFGQTQSNPSIFIQDKKSKDFIFQLRKKYFHIYIKR